MKIVSRGFTEGFYYKPRVDYEVLREYHEGIIALSACLAGEVARILPETIMRRQKRLRCFIRIYSVREISFWSFRIMEYLHRDS